MLKPINLLLLSIALAFSFLYYVISLGRLDNTLFEFGIIVIILSLIKFYRSTLNTELNGQWLRPSILFVIAFLAVNFQYITDYYLGIKTDASSMLYHTQTFNQCYILGLVGLVAFVLGYSWKNMPFYRPDFGEWQYPQTKFLIVLQVIMFALFIATINVTEFLTGSYYGNAEERSNPLMEGLFYVANALIVIATIRNTPHISCLKEYIKSFPLISLIIIAIYMVLRMLSGDRGPFLYTGLLLMFGYLYATRKKYSLGKVVGFALCGAIFISVVGIARQLDLNASFSERLSQGLEVFSSEGRFGGKGERTCVPFTDELGFSFVCNQVAVDAVEVKGAKAYHPMYMVWGVLNGIPFMPSTIANVLHVAPEERSSSGFTNYYFFGGYERNWGLGTSIITDFYLQWSIWGVLIGLFVTGLMFRKLDNVLFVEDKNCIGLYMLLFVLLFSAKAIYMPRATILVDWARFIQGVMVLFVGNKFLNAMKK